MQIKTGILAKGEQLKVSKNLVALRLIVAGLRKGGKLMTGLTLVVGMAVFWPVVGAELKYAFGQTVVGQGWVRLTNTKINLVDEQVPGKPVAREEPGWTVPDEKYSVYIPKIMAKSRVIPNVDAGDKEEYGWAIKLGVAEAAGLSHPGNSGTTYLFAHSVGTRADFARYNAVFYLLHKLEVGDKIEIVYQGTLYKYSVEKKEILTAHDLKYFDPGVREERLVLQTCYPPGTAWKRMVVVAKRSS